MDGLFVDGRGGDAAGFEDTVDGFLRNGAGGEGATGVAAVKEGGDVQEDLFFSIRCHSGLSQKHKKQFELIEGSSYLII